MVRTGASLFRPFGYGLLALLVGGCAPEQSNGQPDLERRTIVQDEEPECTAMTSNVARQLLADENMRATVFTDRLLSLAECAYGFQRADYAAELVNLAELYLDKAGYVKAALLLERAVELQTETLGREHPDTAATLDLLATARRLR